MKVVYIHIEKTYSKIFYIFRANEPNVTENCSINSGYLTNMPSKLQINWMIFSTVIARHAHRQTNRQTHRQTHKNTDKYANKQTQKTFRPLNNVSAINQTKKLQIQDVANNAYCKIFSSLLIHNQIKNE